MSAYVYNLPSLQKPGKLVFPPFHPHGNECWEKESNLFKSHNSKRVIAMRFSLELITQYFPPWHSSSTSLWTSHLLTAHCVSVSIYLFTVYVPMCVYGNHIHTGVKEAREGGIGCPGTGVSDDCEPPFMSLLASYLSTDWASWAPLACFKI